MRILITGGAGFIGTNLALCLHKEHDVICVDNFYQMDSLLNVPELKQRDIEFIRADIRRKDFFNDIDKVDLIIHCASDPSVLSAIKTPLEVINTNIIGTANCLEMARRDGADFIFMSSSRIYPIKDNVRSLYGATKLSSEYLVIEYASIFNLRYVINRCGIVAGKFQRGRIDQGLIGYWVSQYLTGGKLSYIGYGGTGDQIRDALHVKDLCRLIRQQIDMMKEITGEVFDVGGGFKNSFSLRYLNELVSKVTGIKKDIGSVKEARHSDVKEYISNNAIVTSKTGWKPKYDVEQIIRDVSKWMKA